MLQKIKHLLSPPERRPLLPKTDTEIPADQQDVWMERTHDDDDQVRSRHSFKKERLFAIMFVAAVGCMLSLALASRYSISKSTPGAAHTRLRGAEYEAEGMAWPSWMVPGVDENEIMNVSNASDTTSASDDVDFEERGSAVDQRDVETSSPAAKEANEDGATDENESQQAPSVDTTNSDAPQQEEGVEASAPQQDTIGNKPSNPIDESSTSDKEEDAAPEATTAPTTKGTVLATIAPTESVPVDSDGSDSDDDEASLTQSDDEDSDEEIAASAQSSDNDASATVVLKEQDSSPVTIEEEQAATSTSIDTAPPTLQEYESSDNQDDIQSDDDAANASMPLQDESESNEEPIEEEIEETPAIENESDVFDDNVGASSDSADVHEHTIESSPDETFRMESDDNDAAESSSSDEAVASQSNASVDEEIKEEQSQDSSSEEEVLDTGDQAGSSPNLFESSSESSSSDEIDLTATSSDSSVSSEDGSDKFVDNEEASSSSESVDINNAEEVNAPAFTAPENSIEESPSSVDDENTSVAESTPAPTEPATIFSVSPVSKQTADLVISGLLMDEKAFNFPMNATISDGKKTHKRLKHHNKKYEKNSSLKMDWSTSVDEKNGKDLSALAEYYRAKGESLLKLYTVPKSDHWKGHKKVKKHHHKDIAELKSTFVNDWLADETRGVELAKTYKAIADAIDHHYSKAYSKKRKISTWVQDKKHGLKLASHFRTLASLTADHYAALPLLKKSNKKTDQEASLIRLGYQLQGLEIADYYETKASEMESLLNSVYKHGAKEDVSALADYQDRIVNGERVRNYYRARFDSSYNNDMQAELPDHYPDEDFPHWGHDWRSDRAHGIAIGNYWKQYNLVMKKYYKIQGKKLGNYYEKYYTKNFAPFEDSHHRNH
ncbi:MAG: hypothetical protein SGILL_003257 [Bacillariaceae sp.]